jgi:hypothetical protein
MITVGLNKVFVEENIALGNHMFQYSICRIVAMENNYKFYIPYSGHLKKCFPNIDLGESDGFVKYNYYESFEQNYDENIFRVKDFTNLNGYFQTEKYYSKYKNLITEWFKIESCEKTNEILSKYPIDKFCYIHIRGGDNKIGTNNWLIPKKYYEKAINEIKQHNKNLSFVIVTDDVELSKSYFDNIEIISNDVITDFKVLFFSKYCIISASTFSWWAAWLNKKELTIAPKFWLNYNQPEKGWYPNEIKCKNFTYL